jgi:nitrogen fixation/metabolism regulation signal transduction histidine kinase
MHRLRDKLVLVFLAATLAPLLATLWMTTSLLQLSLSYTPTRELDDLSRSLESTGREFYQSERESVKAAAQAGKITPRYLAPEAVPDFWESREPERFALTGEKKDTLEYLVRERNRIAVYRRPLGLEMGPLTDRIAGAREIIAQRKDRDLRRGFTYTYVLLTIAIWVASLIVLVYVTNRISRPIQLVTAGLSELAKGNFTHRLPVNRDDETGRATQAFNHTAAQLQQSRDRLVYLTQLASWQVLARKMAHEVKNSLTPIRLTVEEMVARHAESGSEQNRQFLEQAAAIVVDEVESLERRVRAFSEFSAEPDVCPTPIDVNSVVEERIAFLKNAHPEVSYAVRLAETTPSAMADEDLVKGILVNLLENAAEAAGEGGRILAATSVTPERVVIEVHDSGPGLSEQARKSVFQPTISFKKRGMGLGLSIARKSALVLGGDILLVAGELGGAGFRVILPVADHDIQTRSDS